MNYDFNKIISFFFGKSINKLTEVLKVVLNNGFNMISVDPNLKIIYLQKNNINYHLVKNEDRLLIYPENYKSLSFADEFGEVIEICLNVDGDATVSSIFNINDGVCSTTSVWHYTDNLYTQVVARVMYIENEKLNVINNRESIEMFINTFYSRRNEVFNSLYWDMDTLRKENFINAKLTERIQINDGYKKEVFEELYKRYIDKVYLVLNEKKSSLF